MRLTEDRYHRDRARLDLALRLIGHEARTQTIRRWTGLTDDRIRKLYRSYIKPGSTLRRRRGKSPQQVSYFLRSLAMLDETHALASIMILFGALPNKAGEPATDIAARSIASLTRGRLLCDAYETYRRVVPEPQIEFEHAAFLVIALHQGDEIRSLRCDHCAALNVTERIAIRIPSCRACHQPIQRLNPLRHRPVARLDAARML